LDVEGSLLSLQLVALCGQGRPGCEVGIVDHYGLLILKGNWSRPWNWSENRGRSGGHEHWLRSEGGGRGDRGCHGKRRMLDGGGCHSHWLHRADDGRALLNLCQGFLQLDEGRTSWSDYHSLLNVVELFLDSWTAKLELAGRHCRLGNVDHLLDYPGLSFHARHRYISHSWHVVHSGDCS
jgi:hypothetical protein